MSEGRRATHSVPRADRGRPNRQKRGGGNRGNQAGGRGRGSGGRGGRGRGGGGRGGGGGGGGGGFSRKGGSAAGAMGYDGDAVLMAKESYHPSQSYSYNPAPRGRGRGYQVAKVPIQRLHMTSENQDMVKDMLKDLHFGEDFEVGEEADYDEIDFRAEDQYWLSNSKLVVEETQAFGGLGRVFDVEGGEGGSTPHKVPQYNTIALNKLLRYGFDKGRCEKALEENDGDIGRSLETLLSQCYGLKLAKLPADKANGDYSTVSDEESDPGEVEDVGADVTWEEILEQRAEEMTALMSIYGDGFSERIPNQVWVVSLSLDYLSSLVKKKVDSARTKDKIEKVTKLKWQDQDLCRFYLRGHCRFGGKCRQRHGVPYNETASASLPAESEKEECLYHLEIRFPHGNRYPYSVPFVALTSTNPSMEHHVCLNLTNRLMEEAKELAECGLPAVYSLVTLLEKEDELRNAYEQGPSKFSLPEPVIHRNPLRSLAKAAERATSSSPTPWQSDDSDTLPPIPDYRDREPEPEEPGGSRQEDMRKRYMKKEQSKTGLTPVQMDKHTRQLKDKFRRVQEKASYQDMMDKRRSLPAWDQQGHILSAVKENQVLVISGMTGCGKTTQVPQFILDHFLKSKGNAMCNIVCTQPRRLSAMAVAERVSQERAEKTGGIVGYQIRMESNMSSQTRLLFCTTGILLRRLEGDSNLDNITHIIIDEVHERSEESDFLMLVLKGMLPRRRDLKVILMSATLNANLFSQYFKGCPVIDIPGRTFPVDEYFLEDTIEMTKFLIEERSPYARPLKRANAVRSDQKATRETAENIDNDLDLVNLEGGLPPKNNIRDENLSPKQLYLRYPDYKKKTVKCMAIMDFEKTNYDLIESVIDWVVEGNHKYPKDGAILVFLPGMAEITTMFDQLQGNARFGTRNKGRFKLIPLHSTLSSEDQQAVFSRAKPGVIKVVLATNIAETSITIDDVVFVIDAGKMKEKRYDSSKGMESLDTVWVSRANALQRKGRAGRVALGACFHLFTGHRYHNHLSEQPIPEIQRAPLERIVLRIKLLEIFKRQEVENVLSKIIECPSKESIDSAVKRLENLGALDANQELTPLGYHLASLPVDVRIGKLMLFGAIFRCLDPALTIAATLSYRSPFVSPFNSKEEATAKKQEFAVGNSDHLTMLKAYKAWANAAATSNYAAYQFCQENFLSIKTLQMLGSMKRQFVELLADIGFVQKDLTARRMEKYAKDGGDGVSQATGQQANCNSENMRLVAAILVAALYPNVVQVLSPESKFKNTGEGAVPMMPKPEDFKFKTKSDGYIHIHPSSVNFQVRYYESPYLVYHEKVKTSRVYIRDCTMVSVYPLLLFGGNISLDLNKGQFILSVNDGWIRFLAASHQVAELVRELRLELDQLLQDKIENPDMDLCTCPRGSRIIATIVKLITTQ